MAAFVKEICWALIAILKHQFWIFAFQSYVGLCLKKFFAFEVQRQQQRQEQRQKTTIKASWWFIGMLIRQH